MPAVDAHPRKSRLAALLDHFAGVEDPRDVRRILHPLPEILLLMSGSLLGPTFRAASWLIESDGFRSRSISDSRWLPDQEVGRHVAGAFPGLAAAGCRRGR